MDITIDTTGAELVGAVFGSLARSKLIARTVNDLAFASRPPVLSELASSMTLRNRFSAAGIQVDKANINDANPVARVGIDEKRSYLVDHVTGKSRRGGKHGRAIPVDMPIPPTGRIAAKNRPRAIVAAHKRAQAASAGHPRVRGRKAAPKPFLGDHDGGEAIYQRTGSDSEAPLLVLYIFKPRVWVRKEFDMPGQVAKVVNSQAGSVLARHMERAMGNKGER